MKRRRKGYSQKESGKIFTNLGMGEKYGSRFEKKVLRQIFRAKALSNSGKQTAVSLSQLTSVFQIHIKLSNEACNESGMNPLFFSRRNILNVRENKLGMTFSLNRGAIWSPASAIDSLMKQNFEEFL